eukprot:6353578-Amphidinium_carterae.1
MQCRRFDPWVHVWAKHCGSCGCAELWLRCRPGKAHRVGLIVEAEGRLAADRVRSGRRGPLQFLLPQAVGAQPADLDGLKEAPGFGRNEQICHVAAKILGAETGLPSSFLPLYVPLKSKEGPVVVEAIRRAILFVESVHTALYEEGKRIFVVFSDNGSEFNNRHVTDVLHDMAVHQNFTSGYSPQSSGAAEVNVRIIILRRTVVVVAGAPNSTSLVR